MGAWVYATFYKQITQDSDISEEFIETVLSKPPKRIQICWPYIDNLSNESWKILNERIFAKNNYIELRLYGAIKFDAIILKHLKNVKILSIEASDAVMNMENISALTTLESFAFEAEEHTDFSFLNLIPKTLSYLYIGTGKRNFYKTDINTVAHLENLKEIFINGYNKNLASIFLNLKLLHTVTLRYISGVKSPDFLIKLPLLKQLHIKSGGFKNLDILGELKNIQILELWNTRSITQLDFISKMNRLQYLALESVNGPIVFPKISDLLQLRKIRMEAVRNIKDFSALSDTRSVIDFSCHNIFNQVPDDFLPIMENENIKHVTLHSEKVSLNKELKELCKKYNKKKVESSERFDLFKPEDAL